MTEEEIKLQLEKHDIIIRDIGKRLKELRERIDYLSKNGYL